MKDISVADIVQKLTSVLAENNGTAAVVSSAEGGIFDILAGIYTQNVNIDVFLKAPSGDNIRVDRIGRSSESIFHPAPTVLLAVQPSVLSGMMRNLIRYRISLALYESMVASGDLDEAGYCRIRTILNKKYGLSSCSIFAESA